jgi:glycosyltransferase involved in cell wall biosynthesis
VAKDKEGRLISIVVPCLNEEQAIHIFYNTVNQVIVEQSLDRFRFEFIFVDDGSEDKTLEIIKSLVLQDDRVHCISFSRHFGKEAAMYAGLKKAAGDYVVTMDVDLQDPPELLSDMIYAVEQEGYDCAATRRVTREGEPPVRSFFAKLFYRLINKLSDTQIIDGARDYRFMTRTMVDAVLSLSEYNRFSKGIFGWVGFKTKWFEFKNIPRSAGETKWSFWSLFLYSIEGIVGFSTVPLALASCIGCLFCLIALIMVIVLFARAMIFGDPVAGWPSLACIITFIGGVQLLCIGVMGIYLSRMYLEVKNRPIYIAKEEY